MKKLIVVLVLMTAVAMSSHAQAQGDPQSRAYRKAARKAQNDMVKYNKHQQKAMRKSAKAQQKALKRAQHRNQY